MGLYNFFGRVKLDKCVHENKHQAKPHNANVI